MALRDESTTWIHHVSTPVSLVSLVDALTGLSFTAQAQSLVDNQLVSGETVMMFDHLLVFRFQTYPSVINVIRAQLRHIVSNEAHGGSFFFIKQGLNISC